MRTWSQRGYVTFPRSHGNRTRSGSQLRPGRGSLHRPQRGVEGGSATCRGSGLFPSSSSQLSSQVCSVWEQAHRKLSSVPCLPRCVPSPVPVQAPHPAFGGFKGLPSSLSTARCKAFSSCRISSSTWGDSRACGRAARGRGGQAGGARAGAEGKRRIRASEQSRSSPAKVAGGHPPSSEPSWQPSALVFLLGPCSCPRSILPRILLTRGPCSQPASVWGEAPTMEPVGFQLKSQTRPL